MGKLTYICTNCHQPKHATTSCRKKCGKLICKTCYYEYLKKQGTTRTDYYKYPIT